MADVIDMPSEAPDRRRSLQPDQRESPAAGSLSPPPPPPPPPPRKRDMDSKGERDDRPSGMRDDHRDSRDRSPIPALPPPPPILLPKDDKNQEYRRRNSPTSPPYCDRRHSPPRRSPPPGTFKRARRDDGGYDRRRGSPRGGYGPDERRGYDRGGSGGRGWYGDERLHARHGNRPSDWPDSRHANYGGDSENIQRVGLMSYKQFILELEDDVLPVEAERRYEEYRFEYISTQKRAYFQAHKEEQWLKDKYHPTNLVAVIERRKELAKSIVKDFLLDLQSGTLDLGPGLTASSTGKSGNDSEPNSEEETDLSEKRRHGRGPAKGNLLSSAPMAHPVSSELRRIQTDIGQAQALVCKLDMEKGIQDNALSSSGQDDADKTHGGSLGPIIIIRGLTTVKGLEGVELLDTLITYLWRVHGVDYYGIYETSEAKGLRHVRVDNKTNDGSNSSGSEWEKKLDSFWQARLEAQDPLEILTAKDKIDAAATEALDPVVRKIRDEKYGWKYGCGAKGCTKLFHAPEFVHKHLKLKHLDLVIELTSKVREDLYIQNYMNDPNAPGGAPIMQQSAPKAKIQRRLLDNRLTDAHGNRIELDKKLMMMTDDDRGDNSPRDTHGGLDGETNDKPSFEAYSGQGLHSAFPSEIPPPVLMPVPGAGPLGPFVPAPPEVAMRMLTDPGGPSSFDSIGGPRGRKGRLGPQLGGPAAPILTMPPLFRHDPRRMRSYRDLDAPDDEVTVLDYRSL